MLGFLLLPLLCIWFPNILGAMTTILPAFGSMPLRESHPGCLRGVGWFALLGPLVGLLLGAFSS